MRDRLRQRLDVAGRDPIAGPAVLDQEGEPADVGGDDGRPAGHRFQGDHAEALVVRRHHHHLGGRIVVLKRILVLRPQERHHVLNPQLLPESLEPHHLLVLVNAVGLTADDGYAEPFRRCRGVSQGPAELWPPIDDPCDCLEQIIDPFQRLDSPDEEDHGTVGTYPDMLPGVRRWNRMEPVQIHPGRDDVHLASICTVQLCQLALLRRRGGDQGIGKPDDFRLHGHASSRLLLSRSLLGHDILHLA